MAEQWRWVVIAIVVLAGIFFWLVVLVRRLSGKGVDAAMRRLKGQKVLLMETFANCFGVESEGPTQVRGNGCLAVTPAELLFVMWSPSRELQILRRNILGVEAADSHLGKSVNRKLLKIRFRNAAGAEDSAAWWVKDLAKWMESLSPAPHGP